MVDTVPDDFSPSLGIADAEGLEKASDGHIELEGLPNTRDIGGIRAADGRYVKHARLLRSGALAGATERDLEVLLDDFDVRTVIDLRTEEERREKPDPEDGLEGVRFDDAPVLNTSTLGVTREGGIKGALKMLRAVQDDPAQIMMDIYERMVLDEASQRGFAGNLPSGRQAGQEHPGHQRGRSALPAGGARRHRPGVRRVGRLCGEGAGHHRREARRPARPLSDGRPEGVGARAAAPRARAPAEADALCRRVSATAPHRHAPSRLSFRMTFAA